MQNGKRVTEIPNQPNYKRNEKWCDNKMNILYPNELERKRAKERNKERKKRTKKAVIEPYGCDKANDGERDG